MPLSLINTFLVQSKERDQSKILLSLTPTIKNRPGLGRVISLALINDRAYRGLQSKTGIFISQILKYYQELPEILALTPKKLAALKDKPNLFEKALERANFLAPQTFSGEELANLNIILACASQNQVQFASRGAISGYLLHKEKEQNKILNLMDEYNQSAQPDQSLFNNLISGSVGRENFVILSIGDVFDYLSINRLQKLFLQSGPEEASLFLEKTLSQINNNSFGGVILSWPEKIRAPKSIGLREFRLLSDAAIKKLIQRKGLNKFETKIKTLAAKIKSALLTAGLYLKRIPPASLISLNRLKDKIISLVSKIRSRWNNRRERSVDLFANYTDNKQNQILTAETAGRHKISKMKTRLGGFFKRRRKMALLVATAVIIIAAGTGLNSYENRRLLESEKYNQLFNEIQWSLDEAESNLIYKNEDRAATVLGQARQLLSQLPLNSTSRKTAFNQLTKNINDLDDKINRRQAVRPRLVSNLPAGLQFPNEPEVMAVYNKNIYSLDDSGNQILKNKQPWLKEPLPPTAKITSLALDGSIYLALADGQILKFTRGLKADFDIKGLAPAIATPVKIFTSADLADLYILELKAKRIVVINKSGRRLRVQYSVNELSDLRDLIVKDKKIYLLNGDKIYSVDIK